ATQKIRKSSKAQRTTSRIARDAAFQRLKEALRLVASNIVVLQYGHTITLDLKRWGFDVTKRSTKATESEAETTPAATPEAEAAPTNGVNDAVELNGSTYVVVESMIS
ncbi:MAG: hypothetical protein KDJ52_35480, partial [Anaerolineae bacterium]|nr:hypothetical protein [Anaerolineae bacterium]